MSKLIVASLVVMMFSACGNDGINGRDGVNGTNGSSCSVATVWASTAAPNGGAHITCQNGTSALILNGSAGKNGTNGVNGTTVTPTQLCTGTPSYPSNFIEDAFCINNQLYAVYSANGGFLTLLTPGAYTSNGIGSSCNFTVAANCKVTH